MPPGADAPPTPLPPQPVCRAAGEPSALCVIVLGDSIGAGEPLEGEARWWVLLERLLAAALPDRDVAVDSWAVSGSRVDVLEAAVRDQQALDSYDVAIIIEGVNDTFFTPLDEWAARYTAALEALEHRGIRVIPTTPPPSLEDGQFKTRYDGVAEQVRQMVTPARPILDIAARWHADGAEHAAGYYADLIHQGPEGQRIMAEMAQEMVLQVLGPDG